jgi:hypothetical protein
MEIKMQQKNIFKNGIDAAARMALESELDVLRNQARNIHAQITDFQQAGQMMFNLTDKRNYDADVAALEQKELSVLLALHKKLGEYAQMFKNLGSTGAKTVFIEMRVLGDRIGKLGGWKSPTVSRSDFTSGCERCRDRDLQQALRNELANKR